MANKANEIFADIAGRHGKSKRPGLIRPGPMPVADKILELHTGDEFGFESMQKTDTAEKLAHRLSEERERYAGFLKDYAPAPDPAERRIDITEFTFSLNGGDAETVKIPHYGGPTGYQSSVYESEFCLEDFCGKAVFLVFKGVDYTAEVYVNDTYAGSHEGFFAPFELDITKIAAEGKNSLKVIVKNMEKMMHGGDKIYAATGLGWDDPQDGWHHCPGGMGIYNSVYAEIREPAHITEIFPRVNESASELWVECGGPDCEGEWDVYFDISVYGQNFPHTEYEKQRFYPSTAINIGLNDTFTEAIYNSKENPEKFVELKLQRGYNRFIIPLKIENPRLWDCENPWLYKVVAEMYVEGKPVSVKSRQFGIRDFTQSADSTPKGKFYLNGRETRLYGANTMGFEQQDVLKGDFDQLIDDILLAKICNMNFWRITQRPVQEEIYEYCDRLGLMIQTDLPLFGSVRINQFCECIRQGGEMERLIRSHPSCILVSYINEPFPNGGNKPHRNLVRGELEALMEALDRVVRLHNPERVIKHVDGDYDPPDTLLPDNHCYPMWYNGHGIEAGLVHKGFWMDVKPGWHYGCGEFGTEGLDNIPVIEKYYPREWLREPFNPKNIVGAQAWDFHRFFYETPETLEDWVSESQRHQAFATRMMTSAFRRNTDMNTFAIHLFIDAFPSGWMKAITDCDRRPKEAFFEYMNALSPVFCNLRSDRFTFYEGERARIESYLCNDTAQKITEIRYKICAGDRILYSGKTEPVSGVSQGYIAFNMPKGAGRIRVSMAAFGGDKILHETTEEYTVYPAARVSVPYMVDWAEYSENKAEFDEDVKKGGSLIIRGLKPGVHQVAGKEITVRLCGMSSLYTLSRDTGHPCVKGLYAGDLAWMYDSDEDRIAALAQTTFYGQEVAPVVLGANKIPGGRWEWQYVCGEWAYGKGRVMINLMDLEAKLQNPCAGRLLSQIDGYMRMEQGIFSPSEKAV